MAAGVRPDSTEFPCSSTAWVNNEWLMACQCCDVRMEYPVGRSTTGARKNRTIKTVKVKMTIGKTNNCLFLAMIASELLNNTQLRLNLFIIIPILGFILLVHVLLFGGLSQWFYQLYTYCHHYFIS